MTGRYVLVDGDGERIPGEDYDDPDRAIDARARLMGEDYPGAIVKDTADSDGDSE